MNTQTSINSILELGLFNGFTYDELISLGEKLMSIKETFGLSAFQTRVLDCITYLLDTYKS